MEKKKEKEESKKKLISHLFYPPLTKYGLV